MVDTARKNNVISINDWESRRRKNDEDLCPLHCRILIADSCETRRATLRQWLADLQPEIVEVSSTSEAVGAITINRVDLVLIDLGLGELGAIEFCRILKKAAPMKFVPLFVMSEVDDMEVEVRALEAGADAFLVMPLRPRTFQARIQASLRHKAMIDSLDDSETVLFSLAQSMEDRDPGLGQHCERLALMASAMGSALGLPGADIVALQRSGYLHDIGKVAVPDHILFKNGPLTSDEWTIMMTHPERGERICSNMRSLHSVLPIIRHHHEKWDGTGYPDKLRGEEIPLLARILQLADIYDALTTARSYKRAFTAEEAITIIRQEANRGWRDPQLVEQFSEILPMFRAAAASSDLSQVGLQALAGSVGPARTDFGPLIPSTTRTSLRPERLSNAQ